MSKFTLTTVAFAAAFAATQKGTKLETYAKQAVSMGFAPDVPSFVSAYTTKKESQLETVSLSQIPMPKTTTAKTIRASAEAVNAFNKAFPSAPRALAVKADGSFYLVSLSKPRKARSTGQPGSNSRISAFVACERGIKAGDKFKVQKWGNSYKLTLNSGAEMQVKRGHLASTILDVYQNNSEGAALSNTAAVLVKYGYKLKQ